MPFIHTKLVASNPLDKLLRREADSAVRMVRPVQATLIARKLGELPIVAAVHCDYLARAGTPVHREIRGNPVVRRVYDCLAAGIPPGLG